LLHGSQNSTPFFSDLAVCALSSTALLRPREQNLPLLRSCSLAGNKKMSQMLQMSYVSYKVKLRRSKAECCL
jgi:hypothetical protein